MGVWMCTVTDLRLLVSGLSSPHTAVGISLAVVAMAHSWEKVPLEGVIFFVGSQIYSSS